VPQRRPRAGQGLAACVLLVAATVAAYSNSLHCPFVFDDAFDIVDNYAIRRLWPVWHLLLASTPDQFSLHGRPVVNVSLAVNYACGRLDPFCYHLTNLGIHVLAGLTLFGIARRTLGSSGQLLPRQDPSLSSAKDARLAPAQRAPLAAAPDTPRSLLAARYGRVANPLAFAVAGIWLLHPLQTQAVTYVIQRFESMMGMFYLLSLYCAIRSSVSARPGWWAAGAVGACLFAMGCKEVAVSLPLVVLLYDRAFLAGSFRQAWRKRRGMYMGLATTWAAFAAWLALSYRGRADWAGFGLRTTPLEYARSQFGVILHYLRLSFWPHPLVFDYGWPVARSLEEVLPGLLAVGALVAASAWALVRRPMWGTLGAGFFLILAPTSSIMPIADLAVEHRMYLPLAAVVAAAVIGAHELLGRRAPKAAALALFAVLVALGSATYGRNQVYSSEQSLWQDTVRKAPENPRAHCNLGYTYSAQGRLDAAARCYLKALEIDVMYFGAHYGLACVLDEQGKTDEAIAHYRRAVQIHPRFANAHYNLAILLRRQGETDQAVAHYQQALQINPRLANAHYNLGNIFASQGRLEEAIAHYHRALAINPAFLEARAMLDKVTRLHRLHTGDSHRFPADIAPPTNR